MRRSTVWSWIAVLGAAFVVQLATADYEQEHIGYLDLVARLGDDTPTGLGVETMQVEVMSDGSYGPDPNGSNFLTKNFIEMSGAAGVSSHANTVAKYQYGTIYSIAPDVDNIYLYSANRWVGVDFLHAGLSGTTPPEPTPGNVRTINNSWIGSFGSTAIDNDALRRADLVVTRDDVLITSGMNNNGGANLPMLSHSFNGIMVGLLGGSHTHGDTGGAYDGPGRMKPEIVSAQQYTSFGTPMVNAAGSLLIENAQTWPGLSSNPNAERSVVLKAVLLAGASHVNAAEPGPWSNDPDTAGPTRGITARPLDELMGVGTLDINYSHMIHTGGEQDGSSTPPASTTADWSGWDRISVPVAESAFWRFDVPELASEVSIIATWHRLVRLQSGTYTLADFDLALWRVNSEGDLVTLIGDPGLPYFGGGNVASQSAVDNVEHLYITDLEPGEYVLELARLDGFSNDSGDAGVAWLFPEIPLAPEDINEDGIVGFDDLLILLLEWGDCPIPSDCPSDVNEDGTVGLADLLLVLAGWS